MELLGGVCQLEEGMVACQQVEECYPAGIDVNLLPISPS